ncbi:hypothetical protein ACFOWM_02945 [Ferruginibacter yonginensis]|uniref:Uncharacterized protein n=1 Tax=Ferruginibacter yonginensis TaxID=1310416 RepID=A0ABV8QS94_9BACT
MKFFMPLFLICSLVEQAVAQTPKDTTVAVGSKLITLSTVVIDNKLNVPSFIEKIKSDTSFYKAFKNLRILNFDAINDIRMLDKKGNLNASLFSKTQQLASKGCRTMKVLEENVTGDFYNDDKTYNYYTAQMYASIFFTKGEMCGETNIVAGNEFSTEGKSGMEKHKEQLKMLFFNPGRRINGLPFMSNKTAIYDDDIADAYDMDIDFEQKNGINCYVFKQKVKPGKEGNVVVDEMNTWFNETTFDVVARTYTLSYDAGVYDFKVNMEVQMTQVGILTVPAVIRYNGNWKAIFKKRERGVFTATLSNFLLR